VQYQQVLKYPRFNCVRNEKKPGVASKSAFHLRMASVCCLGLFSESLIGRTSDRCHGELGQRFRWRTCNRHH